MTTGEDLSEDEALAWLRRLSQRHVSIETLREFREWRRAPANEAAYGQLARIWELAGKLIQDPEIRAAADEARQDRT